MASAHLEDLGIWFLVSLDSNKCDFIRVLSNILKNGKYPIQWFKLTYKTTSDDKNNMLDIFYIV